jgi:hypothetical protein
MYGQAPGTALGAVPGPALPIPQQARASMLPGGRGNLIPPLPRAVSGANMALGAMPPVAYPPPGVVPPVPGPSPPVLGFPSVVHQPAYFGPPPVPGRGALGTVPPEPAVSSRYPLSPPLPAVAAGSAIPAHAHYASHAPGSPAPGFTPGGGFNGVPGTRTSPPRPPVFLAPDPALLSGPPLTHAPLSPALSAALGTAPHAPEGLPPVAAAAPPGFCPSSSSPPPQVGPGAQPAVALGTAALLPFGPTPLASRPCVPGSDAAAVALAAALSSGSGSGPGPGPNSGFGGASGSGGDPSRPHEVAPVPGLATGYLQGPTPGSGAAAAAAAPAEAGGPLSSAGASGPVAGAAPSDMSGVAALQAQQGPGGHGSGGAILPPKALRRGPQWDPNHPDYHRLNQDQRPNLSLVQQEAAASPGTLNRRGGGGIPLQSAPGPAMPSWVTPGGPGGLHELQQQHSHNHAHGHLAPGGGDPEKGLPAIARGKGVIGATDDDEANGTYAGAEETHPQARRRRRRRGGGGGGGGPFCGCGDVHWGCCLLTSLLALGVGLGLWALHGALSSSAGSGSQGGWSFVQVIFIIAFVVCGMAFVAAIVLLARRRPGDPWCPDCTQDGECCPTDDEPCCGGTNVSCCSTAGCSTCYQRGGYCRESCRPGSLCACCAPACDACDTCGREWCSGADCCGACDFHCKLCDGPCCEKPCCGPEPLCGGCCDGFCARCCDAPCANGCCAACGAGAFCASCSLCGAPGQPCCKDNLCHCCDGLDCSLPDCSCDCLPKCEDIGCFAACYKILCCKCKIQLA